MGRRYNAERALKTARAAELKAWEVYQSTQDRTWQDVALRPVQGDRAKGRTVEHVHTDGFVSYSWVTALGNPATGGSVDYMWRAWVAAALDDVSPVESPARAARRKVWERAAARVERARLALEALPPAGHKRRKDGTVYPVAGPRENAARAAGRAAFTRAVGRSLTFAAVVVAFLSLFLSACN